MLEVRGVRKAYGETVAIADLSFRVEAAEFVCIVGPSGCGKTTLMKCISGLLATSAGEVILHGERITAPPPQMALVFQEYGRSLFPWMSVRQNVIFPLRRKGLPAPEQRRLSEESLEAVGLTGFADHYPWQLSGGMQQRVAIARALAYQPEILLMDEPFASVDAQTRADLEDLLLRVWQEFKVTVLFVTHDIDESIYLADRVLVLAPRPTRVQESISVAIARPRDQVETKGLPQFGELRARIYNLIRRQDGDGGARPKGSAPDGF
jgi:NitT/TauT family transport system ATP-binding protein